LARVAPEWLLSQVTPEWFERYGARFEAYRLPQKPAEREALQLQIGQDGSQLLTAIYNDQSCSWLREIPAVEVMRQVWIQQYYVQDGQLKWRDDKDLPPHKLLIVSPDDIEARNRTKRETNWNGYLAHLTETCESNSLNLITQVETTPATTADVEVTDTIHQALIAKQLAPDEHFVDTAYVATDQLKHSQQVQIDLIGPVPGSSSWQAKSGQGFEVSCFAVDWETYSVTCPEGKTSQSYYPHRDKYGHDYIHFRFSPTDCRPCAHRSNCTKSKAGVRVICLRPQVEYELLQAARNRQQTAEFKTKYQKRAGIEGTISQAVRAFDLRRSRFLGLAKTHLQHLATAAAINLTRTVQWWLADDSRLPWYRSPFAKLNPAYST
jgi:transposase